MIRGYLSHRVKNPPAPSVCSISLAFRESQVYTGSDGQFYNVYYVSPSFSVVCERQTDRQRDMEGVLPQCVVCRSEKPAFEELVFSFHMCSGDPAPVTSLVQPILLPVR